ncbi:MAG: FAD-binding protein [bacterium]
MTDSNFESWGRFPKVAHAGVLTPGGFGEVESAMRSITSTLLPRGLGRSYGDSCLNEEGYLLWTKWLNKLHAFDPQTGVLRCDAGVSLEEILRVFVPQGWFLPVSPGTKFVTVGGAIANDIHGKNHHRAGSFGNHVRRFELLRSDGERMLCSPSSNADWFQATIGGLGLTGVILWAEFALKPIYGPYLALESIKLESLEEFFTLSRESDLGYEYTVAWLDCLSGGNKMGRGLLLRANHTSDPEHDVAKILPKDAAWKTFPMDAPSFLLSAHALKAFNWMYYHKQLTKSRKHRIHFDQYFYPLDSIHHWNRMYGKRGFLQWQCVVPTAANHQALRMILEKITRSRLGSFLAVLKEFGNIAPLGMLSFPMPGVTLALDFAYADSKLLPLLDELDEIVTGHGGRIYPAKDARMAQKTFRSAFPAFEHFKRYIDPKLSSSFYRRVDVAHGQA